MRVSTASRKRLPPVILSEGRVGVSERKDLKCVNRGTGHVFRRLRSFHSHPLNPLVQDDGGWSRTSGPWYLGVRRFWSATALQINARSTAFALFGNSHCTNFAHHFIEPYVLSALDFVDSGLDLCRFFRRRYVLLIQPARMRMRNSRSTSSARTPPPRSASAMAASISACSSGVS
jgi:hypothetical protein